MKKIGTCTLNGEELDIIPTKYHDGTAALVLMHRDGNPYRTFTTQVRNHAPVAGEVLVKTWAENEGLREPMLATGLFRDTGVRVRIRGGHVEVWEMKPH